MLDAAILGQISAGASHQAQLVNLRMSLWQALNKPIHQSIYQSINQLAMAAHAVTHLYR